MRALRRIGLSASGRVAVAGVALLVLAGCNGAAVELAAQSAAALHERVAAVRAAADSDDRAAAITAVDAFRAEVMRLVDAGELTNEEAAGLLAHADSIAADVLAEVVEPTPVPTPTPTPEVTPTPEPTVAPQPVQALPPDAAERFNELLRERLTEYVEQRIAEKKAEQEKAEKAERQKRRAEKAARHGKGDTGGHDAH